MMMPSVHSTNYSRNKINFGQTIAVDESVLAEQRRAKKFEEIAQRASDAPPSTTKSFLIVSALMSASALTGAAVSTRFFNFLNGVGALKKITPKLPKTIDFLKSKIKTSDIETASKYKKMFLSTSKALLNGLEDLSKVGVEDDLLKLNSKKANRINTLGKKIKKANPDVVYTKDSLKTAVNEFVSANPKEKEFFDKLTNSADDIKGTNLSRKITRSTAATFMGVGALKEASKDLDNNGVPDCVEFGQARKESTQKLTAALLDCAIDSI